MNSMQPVPVQQVYQVQPGLVQQNKVASSKGWHNTKIVLGSLSMTFAIIILGIGGGLASSSPSSTDAWLDLIFGYCPACLALCWQLAEFITVCVRRDRGIHPGAHVALHLIIWMGSAICAAFLTILAIDAADCGTYRYCYDYFDSTDSQYSQYIALTQALTAFTYLLFVIHFILFVRACIECNRRNRNGPTVIMVSGQPGMYYMPAPMAQPGQHPMAYALPLQAPSTAYAPHQAGAHTSMYGGGYYAPPTVPEPKAELQSTSPSIPPSVTPVSAM